MTIGNASPAKQPAERLRTQSQAAPLTIAGTPIEHMVAAETTATALSVQVANLSRMVGRLLDMADAGKLPREVVTPNSPDQTSILTAIALAESAASGVARNVDQLGAQLRVEVARLADELRADVARQVAGIVAEVRARVSGENGSATETYTPIPPSNCVTGPAVVADPTPAPVAPEPVARKRRTRIARVTTTHSRKNGVYLDLARLVAAVEAQAAPDESRYQAEVRWAKSIERSHGMVGMWRNSMRSGQQYLYLDLDTASKYCDSLGVTVDQMRWREPAGEAA